MILFDFDIEYAILIVFNMLKMILTLKSRSFKGTFGIFDFLWISSVFSGNFRHFRTFVYRVPERLLSGHPVDKPLSLE